LYDALIVGAGLAGSYIASELAAQGHRVLVFEQQEKIGKATCCTGIVGKECLDAFPIGREAILREARSARFFIPLGESFRLEKETAQAYIIDRPVFDSAMARKAQEEGAEYLLDTRVKDIAPEKDFARLKVESKGQKASFEGKAVVVASGFDSKLTQSLGLGKSSDFVMGAQAEVEADKTDEVEVYFGNHIAPGFFAWLVPTFPGRALAGLLSRHNTGSYLRNFLAELSEQGKIATPEVEIKYGGIPLKPLHKTSRERVLVVGDAAGQVKPTTGGGIYYSLLSAQIAVDTLHQALSDNSFTAKEFSGYEKKWRRMLSRELRIDYWTRWLFERLDDKQIEQVFHTIQAKHIPESLLDSTEFSFDWHSRLILKGARHLGLGGAASLMWHLLSARLLRSHS
jgi:digeranylgeranylglycerophospholipid reductase